MALRFGGCCCSRWSLRGRDEADGCGGPAYIAQRAAARMEGKIQSRIELRRGRKVPALYLEGAGGGRKEGG